MYMKEYDYLVVGAGLFAAVFVRQAIDAGKRCLVIDKRSHIGGNIYCENVDGIHVHLYGAHIFHTDNKEVWDYVNRFVTFNRYTNSPLANYEGILYNLPFNMNTFNKLWGVNTPKEAKDKIEEQRSEYAHIQAPANLEEQALTLCGKDIYQKLIKGYTEKQWGRPATELPAFIIKRLPFRFVYDNNYFNDEYQGIPKGGYNKLIESLFEGADVRWGRIIFLLVKNWIRWWIKYCLPDVLTSITIFVSGIWNTVVFVLNTNVWKWKIIRGMRSLIIVKERFLIPVLSNINISNLVSSRIR